MPIIHVLYCILILNAYNSQSLENTIVVVQQVCTQFLECLDINIKIIEILVSGNWTYSTNWGQEIFPMLWCKDYKAVIKITIIEDSLYSTTNYICIVREDQLATSSSLTTVLNREKGIQNEPVDQQKQSTNWGSTVWKSLKYHTGANTTAVLIRTALCLKVHFFKLNSWL